MFVISAQSHSKVMGICHRSCGTNGCWKLSESKGGPIIPVNCCCCMSLLPWMLGVMPALLSMLANSELDVVGKSRGTEERLPLTGSGIDEKPLSDGSNGGALNLLLLESGLNTLPGVGVLPLEGVCVVERFCGI